jgi:hypothetical protein
MPQARIAQEAGMDTFLEVVGFIACGASVVSAIWVSAGVLADYQMDNLPSQVLRKRIDRLERAKDYSDAGYTILSNRIAKIEVASARATTTTKRKSR